MVTDAEYRRQVLRIQSRMDTPEFDVLMSCGHVYQLAYTAIPTVGEWLTCWQCARAERTDADAAQGFGPCVCGHSWDEHRDPKNPGCETTGCYGTSTLAWGEQMLCGCTWFRPRAAVQAAVDGHTSWDSRPWFRPRSEIDAALREATGGRAPDDRRGEAEDTPRDAEPRGRPARGGGAAGR